MSDLVAGILGTACACSMGFILMKLCSLRAEVRDVSPDYLLITKTHYDDLCKAAAANDKKCILEQPLLPEYTSVAQHTITEQTLANAEHTLLQF